MKNRIVLLPLLPLAAILLTACVADPLESDGNACRAAAYQHLIGQPKSVLVDLGLDKTARIGGPGAPDGVFTADYVPARMNINIDAAGRIENIHCG